MSDEDLRQREDELAEALARRAAWVRGMDRRTWVTQEGERIKVEQLGDRHLGNIIRLLRRMAAKLGAGDGAIADTIPCWNALLREQEERRSGRKKGVKDG